MSDNSDNTPNIVPADKCPDCGERDKSDMVECGDAYSVWSCKCGALWRWDDATSEPTEPSLEAQGDAYIKQWEHDNADAARFGRNPPQTTTRAEPAKIDIVWHLGYTKSNAQKMTSRLIDYLHQVTSALEAAAQRIADLEAQLDALRNSAHRVEVETLRDGCDGVYVYTYRAYVLSGHEEAFVSEVEESYNAARSAAVAFIEGLAK